MNFQSDFRFTETAGRLLPPGQTSLRVQALASVDAQSLVRLHIGDKVRFASIPNCPWFVVSARYYEIGDTTTLTTWLDAPAD